MGPGPGDPYGAGKQNPMVMRRGSNGYAIQPHELPPGAGPGPVGAPPGAPAVLPDYMRVSMNRMVAGWSAPNAQHGALSGFNDVWLQRGNSNRHMGQPQPHPQQPPGPGVGMGMGMGPGVGGGGMHGGPGQVGAGYPGTGGRPGPGPGFMGMGMGLGGGADVGFGGGLGSPDGTERRMQGPARDPFEGQSLEAVLASKPKKDLPNFSKKK